MARTGALLALLVLVPSCGVPDRPVWWPSPKAPSGTGRAAPSGTGRTAAAPAVPAASKPWKPGTRQLGIAVYWVANPADSPGVVRSKARRIIDYAISLNANSISVAFPFYTYGLTSDTVYASPESTPSPAEIAIFLQEAAKSRIRVTLRPTLDEQALIAQNALAWRGMIEPTSMTTWFASYQRLLLPYARVAATGHAASFTVGVELSSIEQDPRWAGLVQAISAVYPGELMYDETYQEFQAHNTHMPLADFGVDAWPRLDLPDSATVAELTAAWDAWLGSHQLAVRERTILEEAGTAAVPGAYYNPGRWISTANSPLDPQVQANWYQAACQATGEEQIGGVYWWDVSFDADPAHPAAFQSDRITFLGRPTENVIKDCFARLSAS